ncbi:RDD family protein [Alkalibacillus almallahensis]|uniref:RDD family protein n=1 Tax=Alkalibacillus almallahensis TaxID=1379154 RepID=UPI0014212D2F|nr:RDD family protein [Alkalibacillus almallahensis]NIK12983.1 putative RDD family membrane protein YckC [Alkalibacillus almallahensis]
MSEVYEAGHQEVTERTEETSFRYAGFWMRFWAYIVDLIIVFCVNGIVLMPYRLITGGDDVEVGFWTVAVIISTIVLYAYFVVMTKYLQQTLGKRIFGLKVIRQDRTPLRWSDLIFREVVGRFFHRVLGFTNLLYIVVAFNPDKQGIHDMIGDTFVVHDA